MFSSLTQAPPDAILGLTEAFNRDTSANKINLGVGVYKDANGKTPIMECVKAAERRLLSEEISKSYRPITGDPQYGHLVQALLFGADHEIVRDERGQTAHCPGGTGGLRVVGDFLKRFAGAKSIFLPDSTWANHPAIFKASGLEIERYPYFDAATNGLRFDALTEALKSAPSGSIWLFHGCCHNPTGVDPSAEQWATIAELCANKNIFPVLDFAYQGLGDGLNEDAVGLRALTEKVSELVVCSSFSKNFGLYNERTGAVTLVGSNPADAQLAMSNLKLCIRSNYSNPPAHGASIVRVVLEDEALCKGWHDELTQIRARIQEMRKLFVQTLSDKGAALESSFILQQKGMFSMSGLTKVHAVALREKHAIYIVDSGRINVAGMTVNNMERLCSGIVDVL